MKLDLIAQLALAGGLTGFLIGPDSLDQFIGMIPNHSIMVNVIVGVIAGTALGAIASMFDNKTE